MALKRFSLRFLISTMTFVAFVFALATYIPKRVSLDFPMSLRSHVKDLLHTNQIGGRLLDISYNSVSRISSSPGWGMWASEEILLSDAKQEGYFCIITYESLYGNKWKRSHLNAKCSHGRIFLQCDECKAVCME